jgi:two-component system, OmpR family, phosphate regulon sensor histidine kinase PhoR
VPRFVEHDLTVTRHRDRDLKRRGEFNAVLLAMAGHDLRQPLQDILSSFSLLARYHPCGRERQYIEGGELAVAQLTGQLDRLVEALRVNERSFGIKLVPVALQPLLTWLCRDHAVLAAQKGLNVRLCQTQATVLSDATLLETMLRNLLSNAIKHTPAGGRILVGCRRHDLSVHIEVHDTGVGIPVEHLSRVFEAFHRLDSTRSDGLGLGLFVVRRAADLLGHHVEVRSAVGCGSCFSVLARDSSGG